MARLGLFFAGVAIGLGQILIFNALENSPWYITFAPTAIALFLIWKGLLSG